MATVPFAPSSEPGAGGAVPPHAEAERAGGGCAWGSVTGGRGGSGGRSAGGGWVWAVARPPRQPGMAEAAGDAGLGPAAAQEGAELAAVIGATVPTGFEHTAAEEVQEKLGSASRISRDRGKIYFDVPARSLPEVRAGSPRRSLLRCTPCGRGGSVPFGSVWFRSVPFRSVLFGGSQPLRAERFAVGGPGTDSNPSLRPAWVQQLYPPLPGFQGDIK